MRLRLLSSLVVAVAAAASLGACTDRGVGRYCINPTDGGVTGVQLVTPALECPERICYLREGAGGSTIRSVCTARCESDDDCRNAIRGTDADRLCNTGFACAVATVTGPFRCAKVCICRSDIEPDFNGPADGGTPNACNTP